MKIRTGYVSNSSSSSFVVIFPKDPATIEELEIMLFGAPNSYYSNPYGKELFESRMVSEYIWSSIKGQKLNDIKAAAEEFGEYDEDDGIKEFNKFFNMRKAKLQKLEGKETAEAFYVFNFSDNDGTLDTALEHGNIFDRLEYRTFSHH